jgi:cell division protein FtsL
LRRSLARLLVCALAFVAGALLVVGLRIQQVHLAYQLDELRAERARVETLVSQLEVEVATLRSPARVETRARRLGLTVPAQAQILIAREFVAGGSGLAAVNQARVEASLR